MMYPSNKQGKVLSEPEEHYKMLDLNSIVKATVNANIDFINNDRVTTLSKIVKLLSSAVSRCNAKYTRDMKAKEEEIAEIKALLEERELLIKELKECKSVDTNRVKQLVKMRMQKHLCNPCIGTDELLELNFIEISDYYTTVINNLNDKITDLESKLKDVEGKLKNKGRRLTNKEVENIANRFSLGCTVHDVKEMTGICLEKLSRIHERKTYKNITKRFKW